MATMTTENEQALERARSIAVSLDAELAVVASLVRAADELAALLHTGPAHGGTGGHECPACQLVAWAASA